MKVLVLLLVLLFNLESIAKMFPENDLRVPRDSKSNISKKEFESILDKINSIYSPIIEDRKKTKLVISGEWNNDGVNAYTYKWANKIYIVVYGGLARHQFTTKNALALVVCHELGHHLGGGPMYPNHSWATNEGQSDYWGALKCLKKVEKELNFPVEHESEFALSECNNDQSCYKTAMAGLSIGKLFADMRKIPHPKFETPDPTIVEEMHHGHSKPQCRVDTYFQAALCDKDFLGDELCLRSDGYEIGVRPLCWFK